MRDESEIHPDMKPLLAARVLMAPAKTPAGKRANWTRYTSAIAIPRPPHILTEDRTIPTPDHAVPVRVYRREGQAAGAPVLVYLHGGGFMLGDLDSSDSNAWGLCEQTGAVVVSVDYRLTPEHPYPAAFNDCYGVVTWLAAHGAEIGIDQARIALCGDSAGGSLGAACCLAARDRGGPVIAAQALVYPTLGADPILPSYIESKDGPSLTTEGMIYYNDIYFSGFTHAADPYAAPLKAPDVSHLPPAFIHTAAFDPIRDDGRAYAARLAAAGVWVTYREARRMLHGFLRMREAGPQAREEFAALCGFLRYHLEPAA
jgi:acetyl esterase